ncbi:N-acetylglucosamine-specific PTS transporter subunit IIBC [Furfurilactobacillus siliginis]|uniref:N-acetylglucosamine and glucose PTS, EIICBA n=1 Tax=Furfurilactobacillus siliginis TaxID=348151 RepID=A0A0R2LAS4_9LACO|nr:N-acetylglucosamine-specific PTS transporter subunit IIBC [Furfurilactobacillus siliginis]KRN96396.1 N-acetylglucosamine and glucose PTS, EIICBA [Furfurilactobacillus siliginis]GEK29308.1 PTS N-acetylglucosamine transporter subunit IIABC [Furfurilactobacillus siliginis]
MKDYFQKIGRSLMLPVATLPAAALLTGIGHWIGTGNAAGAFLINGGMAILDSLALLFAIGLALGMSEKQDGAAAVAGLVAYLIPSYMLNPVNLAGLLHVKVSAVNPAFTAIHNNVLIGIIAGLIAAALYNRFHETKLPMALSFFSGKRSVPILAAVSMLVITLVLLFVWPAVYGALVAFGTMIAKLGWVGAGLYGFFNRLLIPTGLHHALNAVFWFNVAGINDMGKWLAGTGTAGVTGMYMAGFFPVMMFGLPAGAYAIYRNAKPENKKQTGSLMLAGAFASFFTGVSEPLEFSFMFVAWPLYVLHAIFTGLSLALAAAMHWTAGFSFSAGFVDFLLSTRMPLAHMPLMLLVQGLFMGVIYFFGFDFAIKRFDLKTPGREDATAVVDDTATDASEDKYLHQGRRIWAAIGGKENVQTMSNCTTRLRWQLVDTAKVDIAAIKAAGAAAVNVLDVHNIQIIIGTEVQFVEDALEQIAHGEVAAVAAGPVDAAVATKPAVTEEAKTTTTNLVAVADGQQIDLADVADSTFAGKLLGDGYAIEPVDGKIASPVDGKISMIFPTKHAFGVTTENGLEILVHVGINTVELDGKPFTTLLEAGTTVKAGDNVLVADLDAIKAADKAITTMVVVTNMDVVTDLNIVMHEEITRGDDMGVVTVH